MVTYLPFVLILAAEVTSHDVYRSPLKGPYGPHRREISFAGTGPKPPFPFVTGKSQPPSSPQSTAPTNVRPTTTETTSLFSFSPSPERIPPQHSNASFIYAPTGAAPVHSGIPRPAMNGTCQGATVNLVDASLDWWYTKTYTHIDSTFLIQFNNNHSATGWTLVPALSTLNITSAIANPTCISQTAYNMNTSETMLKYSCWDTPTPVAAATTTVEQTAYMSINATSAKGSIPSVAITPTPAALTIGNSTKSVSSGPPVVYFSKYEVVSKRPTRHWNGDMRCLETTQAHNLSRPLSFEYSGEDHVNGSVAAEDGVSGVIHFAVLRALGQDTASAGSFVASPTVVVVVKKVVAAATALASEYHRLGIYSNGRNSLTAHRGHSTICRIVRSSHTHSASWHFHRIDDANRHWNYLDASNGTRGNISRGFGRSHERKDRYNVWTEALHKPPNRHRKYWRCIYYWSCQTRRYKTDKCYSNFEQRISNLSKRSGVCDSFYNRRRPSQLVRRPTRIIRIKWWSGLKWQSWF